MLGVFAVAVVASASSLSFTNSVDPFDPPPRAAGMFHLAMTGDLSFTWRPMPASEEELLGVANPLTNMQPVFDAADLTIANMEGIFVESDPGYAIERYNLWIPTAWAKTLAPAGIDVVSTANNHAMDGRAEGVLANLQTLEEQGLSVIGTGPTIERARRQHIQTLPGGNCLAIVPATTKSNLPVRGGPALAFYPKGKTDALIAEVRKAKARCPFAIVYIHWGMEAVNRPIRSVRALAHAMVDAGADLVVGHHPHVLQGIEYRGHAAIAYSLGNLVFNNATPEKSRTGILWVSIDPGDADGEPPRLAKLELIPARIRRADYMPHPARTWMAADIHKRVRDYSRRWRTGVELVDGRLLFVPPMPTAERP